jgi:hypothetical protein
VSWWFAASFFLGFGVWLPGCVELSSHDGHTGNCIHIRFALGRSVYSVRIHSRTAVEETSGIVFKGILYCSHSLDCANFEVSRKIGTSPCAKVCALSPLPTKAYSYTLATERHNVFETDDVSEESYKHIVPRWILSCFSKLLCISIAKGVTKFCTRGARDSGYRLRAMISVEGLW